MPGVLGVMLFGILRIRAGQNNSRDHPALRRGRAQPARRQTRQARRQGERLQVPASSRSMPSLSNSIFTPVIEVTLSTRTSRPALFLQRGNLAEWAHHAGGGFVVDEVTASNWPVASRSSICSGRMGEPQSTCSASASLPQRLETSNHLSEKAPFMQLRTPLKRGCAQHLHMPVQAVPRLPADPIEQDCRCGTAGTDPKILMRVRHRRAKRLERLVTDLDRSRDMKLKCAIKRKRFRSTLPNQAASRISKLPLRLSSHTMRPLGGEVSEWLKAHARRVITASNEGSNPSLSAIFLFFS